jgi:hypothetical protein
MEKKENDTKKNEKFMQGWGFIICIILLVIGVLIGLKALTN